MLMCLISAVLLFVEEVRFIVPVLKVNYGGPQSACVKLMNRVKLLSRSVKAEGDTNKQPWIKQEQRILGDRQDAAL